MKPRGAVTDKLADILHMFQLARKMGQRAVEGSTHMVQQINARPSKMPYSLPMYISLLLAMTAIVPLLATVLSLEFILRPALIGQVKDALCGFSQGKGDEERTSLAFGTLNPDAPTMSLHQLLGQIQPDAEATDARFA